MRSADEVSEVANAIRHEDRAEQGNGHLRAAQEGSASCACERVERDKHQRPNEVELHFGGQ
jgi:hypothetical protein